MAPGRAPRGRKSWTPPAPRPRRRRQSPWAEWGRGLLLVVLDFAFLLDRPMLLEVGGGRVDEESPGKADEPAGKHIGRPVDAHEDAAQPDQQRDQEARAQDVG